MKAGERVILYKHHWIILNAIANAASATAHFPPAKSFLDEKRRVRSPASAVKMSGSHREKRWRI
jgi:hypothetical protein